MERAYLVLKKMFDMLPNAAANMQKLQQICAQSAQRLVKLGAEWERVNLALCRAINEASYAWALAALAPAAKARFEAHGEPYEMVDDVKSGFGVSGPQWIKDAKVYTRVARPGPSPPTSATALVRIPAAAGRAPCVTGGAQAVPR